MATPERGAPRPHHRGAGGAHRPDLRPDLLRRPGHDRQADPDAGREVHSRGSAWTSRAAPASSSPRGCEGRRSVAEGLAEPGGLHHPATGSTASASRSPRSRRRATTSSSRSPASRTRTSSPPCSRPPSCGSARCWLAGAGVGDAGPDAVAVPDGLRRARPAATSTSGTPSPSPHHEHQQRRGPQGAAQGGHAPRRRPTPTPTAPAPSPAARPPARPRRRRRDHPRPAAEVPRARLRRRSRRSAQELRTPGADDPKKPLVTCSDDGVEKYILGPAEVLGTDVKSANAALQTNNQGVATGGWQVNLNFTGDGKKKFGDTTRRLFAERSDPEPVRHRARRARRVRAALTNGAITRRQRADHRQLQPVRGHRASPTSSSTARCR